MTHRTQVALLAVLTVVTIVAMIALFPYLEDSRVFWSLVALLIVGSLFVRPLTKDTREKRRADRNRTDDKLK